MRRRLLPLFVLLFCAVPTVASAEDDCPAGSKVTTEEGFTWCQPSVCDSDAICKPDEVCRPIALCMQVGSVARDAATLTTDAGRARLVATQRCAPDKSCPSSTLCNEARRCVAKTVADRMGILSAAPSASASAPVGGKDERRSCGCFVVGSEGALAGAPFAFGLAILLARRRRSQGARIDADPRSAGRRDGG